MPDEGRYCTVCGGVVPAGPEIRKIPVDGRETGIDQLDRVLADVFSLHLTDEALIREELLKRVRAFNYVPTKKVAAYAEALATEYRVFSAGKK